MYLLRPALSGQPVNDESLNDKPSNLCNVPAQSYILGGHIRAFER